MLRLWALVSRHPLLLGILAAAIALLAILWLQYQSLVMIQSSMPIYRREMMKNHLREIGEDVGRQSRATFDPALNVPAGLITNHQEGVIELGRDWRNVEGAVERVAEHFKKQPGRGVRLYFVAILAHLVERGQGSYARVAFIYNPASHAMERATNVPEFGAIHTACAMIMPNVGSGLPVEAKLTGSDSNSEYRIVVRPIVDESKRMIALAGLVVDQPFFQHEHLPEAIDRALSRHLPAEYRDATVTITDGRGELLYSTHPDRQVQAEAQIAFDLIFTDWRLGLNLGQMTEAQWARRNFYLNLTLWIVMSTLLIGGVLLVLRAASREMKLSQMKSDFVSNVSHELRTPLASIRVFGEFFKLGLVEEAGKMREYGEYIETESRRLTQIINNILDFSRIESGQKSYHFELADVGEVIADTLKNFDALLRQREFKVSFIAPPGPLPPIMLDPDALTQAFVNLLDNAIKYSGEAREIGVELGRKHNWVTVSVSDCGIGIPKADQEKIFERFHRVGGGLVHDVKGTGLGLSIVKHIIGAHRGKITVESEVGRGATFTIHLPVPQSRGVEIRAWPSQLSAGDKRLSKKCSRMGD